MSDYMKVMVLLSRDWLGVAKLRTSMYAMPLYIYTLAGSQELVSAVEEELKSEGDKRARQLQLISTIASDVSEPTTQLISKLNCEAKRKMPNDLSPSKAKLDINLCSSDRRDV